MKRYFNILLEFDQSNFFQKVNNSIQVKEKGYVCVVDFNVLTLANKNSKYQEIINNSIVNTCDGSSIAMLASLIHSKKLYPLNGPEVFEKYIKQKYKQVLIGGNIQTAEAIINKLKRDGHDTSNIFFIDLPYLKLDEFDYIQIAKDVNSISPDLIWVSLGAPKQEMFMQKLVSHLDVGVMLGIGAAFNFYIENLTMPKVKIGMFKFIWVNRLIVEPRKQIKRIIPFVLLLPRLIFSELFIGKRKNQY